MELRPVTVDELPAFARACEAAFHEDLHPEDLARERLVYEPERTLAVFEGSRIVATTCVFTRELTLPGSVVRAACVSAVGVLPTHRRRGLLTALMRRQLDDVRAAAEAIAALWASESAIYGRFGYGLAARSAEVSLRTAGVRPDPAVPAGGGQTVLLEPAAAVARIAPLYDAQRRTRPGHLGRTPAWWEHRLHDPEHRRDGASALRAAVHQADDGTPDGYVLYAVKSRWSADGPDGEVLVRELVADGPPATAALWAYVLALDLTRSVTWPIAPPDEPLAHLLDGPQRPRMALSQNLWLRLVDVSAALTLRSYGVPFDVVLEVDDAFCPWNAGRYRLAWDGASAQCTPTGDPADLALSAADLASAYLGGPTLEALASVGRVRELRAGALGPTALAFRGTREPWCPEIF